MELFDSSEARKNFENILNRDTMEAIYDLADGGELDLVHGVVKHGKESKVLVAERGEEKVAMKVYTIEASSYRDMQKYLLGDPRFEKVKGDRRSIVFAWCSKEFQNLERARNIGIDAPEPLAFEKNVLLMEFIGEDFEPAPKLREVDIENPERALEVLVENMEGLWKEEKLVHGDLSPFNVLVWEGILYTIDFSQAVLESHPMAEELLERDVKNVLNHFEKKYGIHKDSDQILNRIVGE